MAYIKSINFLELIFYSVFIVWMDEKILNFTYRKYEFHQRISLHSETLRLPPQRNDLQLLQKPRVPSSLMPFLRQGSLRRTQTRKYLRSIRKVTLFLISIHKVVSDLSLTLENNIKDLTVFEE